MNRSCKAARLEEGSSPGRSWRVYVPLAKPTYIAYGLVSVSYHWNDFLRPPVITNSVTTRLQRQFMQSTMRAGIT
jgi:sn-glycerol 3-phosphate transport system permease protein